MTRTTIKLSALLAVSLSLTAVLAPANADDEMTPHTQGGIQYVSGGIGQDEVQAIEQLSNGYSLELIFAETGSGAYLSDVKVRIRDASGNERLSIVSDGPYVLAKLPPGRYEVAVEIFGTSQRKTIQIGPRGKSQLYFYWSDIAN